MKLGRIGILLTMLLASVANMSGYVFIEKKFIQQHDVDNETKTLKSDNPIDFWESMAKNNGAYQILMYDYHNNKKTKRNVDKWKSRCPVYDMSDSTKVLREWQEVCDKIVDRVGINDSISCRIVDDSRFNSFSIFAPKGYVVALSAGAVNNEAMTEEMMIGMVAHEYAHIYLYHILQNSIFYGSDFGVNDLPNLSMLGGFWGGIIGGALMGAIDDAAFGNHARTLKPKKVDVNGYNVNYYREMVLEADLIAYRFMEWSGIGGEHYIKLLRLIGANDPERYLGDENSYYTNHQERIRFINYVKDHPEIGNTVNDMIMNNIKQEQRKER